MTLPRLATNTKLFVASGVLIGVALALLVGPSASSAPDGLEKVAEEQGFAEAAEDSVASDGLLADYGIEGVDDESVSTALSGAVGVLLTFGLAIGIFGVLRVLRPTDERPDASGAT